MLSRTHTGSTRTEINFAEQMLGVRAKYQILRNSFSNFEAAYRQTDGHSFMSMCSLYAIHAKNMYKQCWELKTFSDIKGRTQTESA
jgi:hypothetical protein